MSRTAPTPEAEQAERLRRMIAEVDAGAIAPARRAEILDSLEECECWTPYFRLLKRVLDDKQTRGLADYLRLAKVQNLYLEDTFAAAETCASLVTDLALSYTRLCEEVLPHVVEFEDFAAEAAILSAVADRFAAPTDRVSALERLCMLYEKKTHNESQLTKTYEKLLASDPRNVKALRYFKLVFTQSNEWEEVVGILKTLLQCVTHPQELFRVAQELATIYLYQLEMAEEAIATLETHCEGSPLDTSTIMFDAYQRLGDWTGCLKVLRQCLLNVDDDAHRAVLHMKIGGIQEQLGQLDDALQHYANAAERWPILLDALEGVINVAVAKKDFAAVHKWLGVLTERVRDDKLAQQLRQASRRLQDGLEHAGKS